MLRSARCSVRWRRTAEQPGGPVSGRHRSPGSLSRGRLRMPIALGRVAALVALTVVTVRIVAADAGGCAGGITVRVVATPEIGPVLEGIAEQWTATKPSVNGKCVHVSVASETSASVASGLTVYAGRAIDVAA